MDRGIQMTAGMDESAVRAAQDHHDYTVRLFEFIREFNQGPWTEIAQRNDLPELVKTWKMESGALMDRLEALKNIAWMPQQHKLNEQCSAAAESVFANLGPAPPPQVAESQQRRSTRRLSETIGAPGAPDTPEQIKLRELLNHRNQLPGAAHTHSHNVGDHLHGIDWSAFAHLQMDI